jgi:hypothetical protein
VSGAWWPTKVRQFFRHLFGRVGARELSELAGWLTADQMALFKSMHRADQRHGLDVVRALRKAGRDEPDLVLAGLLHDAGKGKAVGVWHRVGWSVGEHYGPRLRSLVIRLPGFRRAFDALDSHADVSAELALQAGCSQLCAELIRHQEEPVDATLGVALRLADEAS